MTSQIPGMAPEVADNARDVLALVRTQIRNDREGEAVLLDGIDLPRATLLLRMAADLAGRLLIDIAGDRAEDCLSHFARNYLT